MKKNKTLAYALAATLLVGGTFVGTKALFTDEIKSVGELTISTGDVDIEILPTKDGKDPDWQIYLNGDEDNIGTGEKVRYDNLKTGDRLEKQFQIKNEGTLHAWIDIDRNIADSQLPNGIVFEATFEKDGVKIDENNEDILLNPQDVVDVTFEIRVEGGGMHNVTKPLSLNSDAQEAQKIDLRDAYIVTAQQVTSEKPKPN